MNVSRYVTSRAKGFAAGRRYARDRRIRLHVNNPQRGDLLWLLDTPGWRQAIPDEALRRTIAAGIFDSTDERFALIARWMSTARSLDLLALALQANMSDTELSDHLDGVRRLDRDAVAFLAALA